MVSGPACTVCGSPLRWFADQNAWGCDRCRQMFPAQQSALQQAPMQQQAPPRPAGSKKPLAIIVGLVVIGGIVIAAVVGGGSKKAGGDSSDLENEELAAVRDQVCACKDEACQREAMGQLADIQKRAADSGVKATKEQHALGKKTFDEIGECLRKKGAPAGTGDGGDIVADMEALRDAACACKNLACTSSLTPKFDQWRDKYMATFNSLPADVKRKVLEATTAQKKCFDQLTANGR
jgi:hypothetical protein